eukprot:NODE_5883_length_669_cov_2.709677_g4977_i0.p1 GENE.NODE_5883_length_669_cov_2.709677_g4977_i0~~NODE_5883_length_669_cov_2.709677_g4977_i0.p1  ORF type:complete len:184 (+),score=0.27 NODE_5883_length_669_cov_2.709677_g4977_i0:35-553(+)
MILGYAGIGPSDIQRILYTANGVRPLKFLPLAASYGHFTEFCDWSDVDSPPPIEARWTVGGRFADGVFTKESVMKVLNAWQRRCHPRSLMRDPADCEEFCSCGIAADDGVLRHDNGGQRDCMCAQNGVVCNPEYCDSPDGCGGLIVPGRATFQQWKGADMAMVDPRRSALRL